MGQITYHPDPTANQMAISLVKTIRQNPDVLGIFLSGSTASGGRDRFSDVDLNVITRNKSVFKENLPELISDIAPLLFSLEPDFLLPDFFIFYMQAGYKFDVYVYGPADHLPHSFSDDAVIVLDRENHLAGLKARWKKQTIPIGLKEKYLAMAMADLWAIRREVYRRDLYEARYNLDDARQCIATYVNLSHSHPYFGFDKFSSFLDFQLEQEISRSLQNNHSLVGILRASLCLLGVIESFNFFEKKVTNTTRRELSKTLSECLQYSPQWFAEGVPS